MNRKINIKINEILFGNPYHYEDVLYNIFYFDNEELETLADELSRRSENIPNHHRYIRSYIYELTHDKVLAYINMNKSLRDKIDKTTKNTDFFKRAYYYAVDDKLWNLASNLLKNHIEDFNFPIEEIPNQIIFQIPLTILHYYKNDLGRIVTLDNIETFPNEISEYFLRKRMR